MLNTPDDLTATLYTDTLISIFIKRAPLLTKTVASHQQVPGFTNAVEIKFKIGKLKTDG